MASSQNFVDKLGIGTAQFGLDYGISNKTGQTCRAEARRILQTAAESQVELIDTAAAYGESEMVLGSLLPALSLPRLIMLFMKSHVPAVISIPFIIDEVKVALIE